MFKYVVLSLLVTLAAGQVKAAHAELRCDASSGFPYQIEVFNRGPQDSNKVVRITNIKKKRIVFQNSARMYQRATQKDYSSGNLFTMSLNQASAQPLANLSAAVLEDGQRKWIADGSLNCKVL